jgi:hypothetical protein
MAASKLRAEVGFGAYPAVAVGGAAASGNVLNLFPIRTGSGVLRKAASDAIGTS